MLLEVITAILLFLNPVEERFFGLYNNERENVGVLAFVLDEQLCQIARQRSDEMAYSGNFTHYDSQGQVTFAELFNNYQVQYSLAAESIARNNYPDPAATAVQGLLNSPLHREGIFQVDTLIIGIGATQGQDGLWYFSIITLVR